MTYPVWSGSEWLEFALPTMDGEVLSIPVAAAVVYRDEARTAILLQRRDRPGEVVRGRVELPGGRWRAGETPADVVRREVLEETGVRVRLLDPTAATITEGRWSYVAIEPLLAVVATADALPTLHVIFEAIGEGAPRDVEGETSDVRYWSTDEIRQSLESDPETFIGPTRATLVHLLGG